MPATWEGRASPTVSMMRTRLAPHVDADRTNLIEKIRIRPEDVLNTHGHHLEPSQCRRD